MSTQPTQLPEEQLQALIKNLADAVVAKHTWHLVRALQIISTLNENTTTVAHARAIAQKTLDELPTK